MLKSELTFYFMVFLFYLPRMALNVEAASVFSSWGCDASGGVCARSAVGSNTQAVFTCVLNESGGPG